MMKKLISLLLVFALLFALCACGRPKSAAAPTSAPASAPAAAPEKAVSPAAAPEPETAPAAVPAAAQEAAPEPAAQPEAASAPAVPFDPDFTFSVTDRSGTSYTESVFAENAITVIIAWTAWSRPSIAELAVLEKLWENYRDRGLMVFGVYGMSTTAEEIKSVVAQTGVSFPLVGFAPAFIDYQSGSIPNTILVDRAGHVLTHTPDPDLVADITYNAGKEIADFLAPRVYVKNMSYEEWEALLLPYLQA